MIKLQQQEIGFPRSTQEAFSANAKAAINIATLIDEIAAASSEQAHGINQINTAIMQIDKVTQSQAATAEESASAAEELNAQATQMNFHITELSAIVYGHANGNGSGKVHVSVDGRRGLIRTNVQSLSTPRKENDEAFVFTKDATYLIPKQIIPLEEGPSKDF
ncbi:MAG: hypothetical protein CSYNP_02287 [Syntrophus sp. SKADARSKE-3]|nr:hypothetical protein [Syntrophus sp. SKADARSKE-3]